MRQVTLASLVTNVKHLAGVDSFLTNETTAVERSLNRFGKLSWERARWPFCSVLESKIPDVRVRSVDVGSGGSSYTSAPTVSFSGGGGSGAAATATIDSDGKVNGIAVTANGTAYTSAPTVAFTGGAGSGAAATANVMAYVKLGTSIAEIFRITDRDPYGSTTPSDLQFRMIYEGSSSEYGLAALENRSSTAPVWVHYRKPFVDHATNSISFPQEIGEYATYGAYADWLAANGQTDKSNNVLGLAEQLILTELDKLERQQSQEAHSLVLTHLNQQNRVY